MKPPRLSLSALTAIACYAASGLTSEAAFPIYEPFDYVNVTENDANQDGKTDLMGLNGGTGWGSAWLETTLSTNAAADTHPRDYFQDFSLMAPTGNSGFSSGGSLHIWGYDSKLDTLQTSSRLKRSFLDPIVFSEVSEVWFSVLLRKDSAVLDGESVRVADRFEIALVDLRDPAQPQPVINLQDTTTSTSFSLSSTYGQLPVFLENRGPNVGATDLLVFKLSIAPNQSKVEFFLNPSLDSLPTVATLTLPVSDDITMGQAGGFQVITASNRTSGPTWSLDEIRVGQTYAQVIPEPSSLLLTGLGVALFGGARLRRSRVSLS